MSNIDQRNCSKINKKFLDDSLFCDLAVKGKLSSNLVSFCRYLRMKGLFVGMTEQLDAMRALEKLDLQDREAFRIVLRITLAKSNQEQDLFDRYFRPFWYVWERTETLEMDTDSKKEEKKASLLDEKTNGNSIVSINDWMNKDQSKEEKETAGYSPFETKSERNFASFKAEELSEIMSLINEIGKKLATRLSLRKINSKKRVSIDLRKTIRKSIRRGGEILDLVYRNKRRKRLKLVLICDVSKSMDLYSRFLIQFIYAFQSVFRRIETFVFSTSLYRITEILKNEKIFNALEQLPGIVPDWSGGTKIGYSLEQFVQNFGKKLVDSETVCLIISDGWDTGDVELLERSMSYLKKRSRNIIWLNPLKGNPGYEPSTRGMQVALPYIDIFSSAHNLNSLRSLASQFI